MLRPAAGDSSAIGDKKLQGKCFAADIASWTGYAPPADAPTPVPPHPGRPTEGRGQSLPEAGRRLPDRATLDTNGSGVLRFVTWNVNNLMGLGGEGASHENVLAALKAMDADVIVLQITSAGGEKAPAPTLKPAPKQKSKPKPRPKPQPASKAKSTAKPASKPKAKAAAPAEATPAQAAGD